MIVAPEFPPPPYAQRTFSDKVTKMELNKALRAFRTYKRALATCTFFSLYYVVLLLFLLAYFPSVDGMLCTFWFILPFVSAIFGVYNKSPLFLLPLLIGASLVFMFYFSVTVLIVYHLFMESPWWIMHLSRNLLARKAMAYTGMSSYQLTLTLGLAAFIATVGMCGILSEIWIAITGMGKYSSRLHAMALDLIGRSTNYSQQLVYLVRAQVKHSKAASQLSVV